MQIVSKKNFILLLAGVLVIALGFMALSLTKRPTRRVFQQTKVDQEIQQIRTQSKSDNIDDIEKDLNNTDLIDIDKELQDIENEVEEATY